MSNAKQILLCLLVLAVGAAGWMAYRNPQVFGAVREAGNESAGEATAARRGAGARGPGLAGPGGEISVITGTVALDETGEVVTALGTAKAARSVTVVPQVTGIVEEVLFTPGEVVEAGDVLVCLDDDEQRVAVDRARITLTDAEAALERSRQLAESRTITTVALGEAESAARMAEIELRTAEIALGRRSLTAPFAGVTGLSDISVGDLVTTSTEIVTLDDLSAILVSFEVPERWAGRITPGQAVTAAAQAVPGAEFRGEVAAVDSRIDEATRTLRMEARIDNQEQVLKPGMAVIVTLGFETPGQLSVPSLSVQWDRRGSYVWAVRDGTVERTPVAIVNRLSGSAIVVAELQPGDKVVVEGVQRLRPGAAVVEVGVATPAAPPAAPPAAGPPSASETRERPARS